MNAVVMGVVLALSGAACLAIVALMVRDRLAEDRTFAFLAAIELVLVVQLVLGCVALASTDRDVAGLLFVSYLVGIVLVLPVGVLWSLAERTRFGSGVLLIAAFTVVALELRLDTIWAGSGA